ncbi:hypothetical protein HNQ77_002241 [Silvibacterium bohemicum]|uniref:Uncharacterized protein n=1 Tax=Silvibacterium bohemicum TaxID=1577686 RepID=A0A841JX34_9BACT|nr:hypothetical protein [Silvibacterium bohemicum]MBB6144289.1 hypothetical protein [Silvibacterium bohemicum]
MPAKPFDASQFVATQWNTAADKATFGNAVLNFIESEWKRSLFTKSFYQRLSNCFGHIAHYDIHGFYETWFTTDRDRLKFLKHTLAWPCWGDPTFTYSDVERVIKQQVRARNYLALYELRAAEELRTTEMAVLTRLEAKYRAPANPGADAIEEAAFVTEPTDPQPLIAPFEPVQGSLF